jgi:DNA-binding MarR family transcriptional regulator
MDPGALAHTLKPLERDGFVATATDPLDRRSRLITLTPAGQAKLSQTDALLDKAQKSFEAAIGGVETAALREALNLLISDGFEASFEAAMSVTA